MRRERTRGLPGSAHAGSRGRNRRCATAFPVPVGGRSRGEEASHRESLAALGPSVLERQTASTSSHPLAETVGSRALALLRLVGAFHGSLALTGEGQYTQRQRPFPVFLALCANAVNPAARPQNPLLYSPPPAGRARPRGQRASEKPPRRSRLALPENLEPDAAWNAIRDEL